MKLRSFSPVFTGASYLLTFALPNFFFHVTAACDSLRHKGVLLGKIDDLRLKEERERARPDQQRGT